MLSEIFVHTLPTSPFVLSNSHAPLLLERVCRQWKDVTRSTPALWSQITVNLLDGFQEHDAKLASICIARSGKHPLLINLGLGGPADHVASGNPAISLLAAQCERWYALRVELPLDILRELSVVRGRLPLLHGLSIITDDEEPEENDATIPFNIFDSAPRLRYFNTSSFQNLADIVTTGSFRLPWSGLTWLVIDERKAIDIWSILKDCPNLVELDSYITSSDLSEQHDVPAIVLPCLRSLFLQLPVSSTILSTLTLPVLEQASFTLHRNTRGHVWSHPRWDVQSGLATLLSQSNRTLSRLRLSHDRQSHIDFGAQDFIGCMERIAFLIELCNDNRIRGPIFLNVVTDQNALSRLEPVYIGT